MILTCSDCSSSYFVPDEAVKVPRAVRCSACGKRWTAESAVELGLVSLSEEGTFAQDSAETNPEPVISVLPAQDISKVYRARVYAERRLKEAAGTGHLCRHDGGPGGRDRLSGGVPR